MDHTSSARSHYVSGMLHIVYDTPRPLNVIIFAHVKMNHNFVNCKGIDKINLQF